MTTEQSKELKRYSTEEISSYLREWKESGKSQIVFSKEQGLNYYTLNKWINDEKRKVKKRNASSKGFTQLKVNEVLCSGLFAEIRKDGTILLHQTVSADFIRALME